MKRYWTAAAGAAPNRAAMATVINGLRRTVENARSNTRPTDIVRSSKIAILAIALPPSHCCATKFRLSSKFRDLPCGRGRLSRNKHGGRGNQRGRRGRGGKGRSIRFGL